MADELLLTPSFSFDNILIFLFVFVIIIVLANIVYTIVRRALDARISRPNSKLIANILQYILIIAATYYGTLYILDFNLSDLGVSLGILTIVIAFSSKEIIQNVLSGILIVVNRPIRLEDWIIAGGLPSTGVSQVVDITLMTTVMREVDGRLIIMPNSSILSAKTINYTKAGLTMIHISLKVPAGTDLKAIEKAVHAVALNDPRIMPSTAIRQMPALNKMFVLPSDKGRYYDKFSPEMFEPSVFVSEYSGTMVTLDIRLWIQKIQKKDEIISTFLKYFITESENQGIRLTKE